MYYNDPHQYSTINHLPLSDFISKYCSLDEAIAVAEFYGNDVESNFGITNVITSNHDISYKDVSIDLLTNLFKL